jgi:hypothetical protein
MHSQLFVFLLFSEEEQSCFFFFTSFYYRCNAVAEAENLNFTCDETQLNDLESPTLLGLRLPMSK